MERSQQPNSDKELFEEFVHRGKEDSFNALVQRHKVGLFNVAFQVLFDQHAAEDVVQRVFIVLLRRKASLLDVRSIRSWLYKTALNLSLNMKRDMRRRKGREKVWAVSSSPETPRQAADRAEQRKELESALAKLKEPLRIALVLRYLQGMSHAEAGEVMNLSSHAIRMRVTRALKKLRRLLQRRGLLISIVAVEEGLRSLPAKAVSANFLTSASSIIRAASTAGIAAKTAAATTSVIEGGLIMTAKSKVAIGVGAAMLAGGTATYLIMKEADKAPSGSHPVVSQDEASGEGLGSRAADRRGAVHRRPAPQEAFLWGQVVGAEGYGVPGVTVEAGVFEGRSPDSLSRKVLVQATSTDSYGGFRFPEDRSLAEAKKLLASGKTGPRESSKSLHTLLVASKEGYVAGRRPLDLESGEGQIKVLLNKAPVVSGQVKWNVSRKPIAGAEVTCQRLTTDLYCPSRETCRTDEEGRFSLTIAAEGPADVVPRFNDEYSAGARVALVPGEEVKDLILTVGLGSETVIEGRVLNAEGEPVARAEVHLSTDKRISRIPAVSKEDGTYRFTVPKHHPYQSYFVDDWPEKPEYSTLDYSGEFCVMPKVPSSFGGKWEWSPLWTPPAHAPPERLVAFHRDYEMGVVEVPLLGPGQVRRGVDIVLHRGLRVSGKIVDQNSEPLEGAEITIKLDAVEGGVLIKNDNTFLHWRKAAPDENGSYDIRFLREGSYELTATCKNCNPVRRELHLLPHEVVEGFDFVLERWTGFIRGAVLDQSGNAWTYGKVKADVGPYFGSGARYSPVVGDIATVGLVYERKKMADVKEDGSYELSEMKAGEYNIWLEVSADYPEPGGILHATSLRNVPTGTEGADIIVTERPAGKLLVHVVDETKQPVQKFRILCCPLSLTYGRNGVELEPARDKGVQRSERGSMVFSNAGQSYFRDARYSGIFLCNRDIESESGEFVAERVAPGKYFVSVKTDRHGEQFKEAEIEGGGETETTFELEALGRLEGIVVDADGKPLQGILVRVMKMTHVLNRTERVRVLTDIVQWENLYCPYRHNRTETALDGKFLFENLERAEYRVTAVASPGFTIRGEQEKGRSVFADVTIGQNGRASVRLVLEYGSGTIEGYVYGEDGGAISKGIVELEGSEEHSVTRSDDNGHYVFADLLPERYLVKARIGGRTSRHYRGREVELGKGEQARVDIVAGGEGEIRGTISLAGDAARADAWFAAGTFAGAERHFLDYDMRLILREKTDRRAAGGKELLLPVQETFDLKNIQPGTYEVSAHYVVRVDPEPLPFGVSNSYLIGKPRYAKFVSKPQIVRVASTSRASVHLTISEAVTPHYPIPDPVTCDKQTLLHEW